MLWFSVTLLALFASVQGRAVNISNTWVLPEEGFPVFYRYFRDRISWYEADAVCQFHHANLVTVDTTAQYDAVRAYLKELDISSAVWVGLIRSNPDGDFTWTDYRGLSGDGYWSSAPDARAAPLCAAADPAADYRWEARACGGPTVASFICELPVPQWALGKDGCMVRALPALTALYLPESAAVQLTADCGLAGVKRVQCTGNVKREELLKDLSCNDEDDSSSTMSLTSTSTIWPATETTFNDQEVTTDELSTAGNIVTQQNVTNMTPAPKIEAIPTETHTETEIPTSTKNNLNIHNFIRIPLNKDINLGQILSNDIPQPEHQENTLTNHHLKAIDENKSYHHRLLHDEMTRLGNLETIFTQPTDHFVPPLVMAKARISDDMTVLSLEEKHAQQIAEQRLYSKHNNLVDHGSITPSQDTSPNPVIISTLTPIIFVKDQKSTETPIHNNSEKKHIIKPSVPKKYIDKYDFLKAKSRKTEDYKMQKPFKIDVASTSQTLISTKEIEAATATSQTEVHNSSEEDPRIDLTVIINEPGTGNGQQIFYSNHTNILLRSEQVTNLTDTTTEKSDKSTSTGMPILTTKSVSVVTEEHLQGTSNGTLNHEVIKITVINNNKESQSSSPVVFEVSTLVPLFHNNSEVVTLTSTETVRDNTTPSTTNDSVASTTTVASSSSSTQTQQIHLESDGHSTSVFTSSNNIVTNQANFVSTTELLITKYETPTEAPILATATLLANMNVTENFTTIVNTTSSSAATLKEITTTEKMDIFNHTDNFEEEHEHEEHEIIDDYQSPLLSAANEPLHRPNRSRRPLPPPNRINKFNPFRILG